MKVSIITSSFNREKTIRGCIESVLAQDYPDTLSISWWMVLLRTGRSQSSMSIRTG